MCGKRLIKQANNKQNRDDDIIIQIKQRKKRNTIKFVYPVRLKREEGT
jgi:hypothetical protein